MAEPAGQDTYLEILADAERGRRGEERELVLVFPKDVAHDVRTFWKSKWPSRLSRGDSA